MWSGTERPPEYIDCVDVDLSFTPATNTLPIRRLGLEIGEETEIHVVWLIWPELSIQRVLQRYTRLAEDRYRYTQDEFEAELTVDRHGLVLEYEGLWRASSLPRLVGARSVHRAHARVGTHPPRREGHGSLVACPASRNPTTSSRAHAHTRARPGTHPRLCQRVESCWVGERGLGQAGRSGLDENHKRLRDDSVVCHRLGGRLRLHRSHDGVHIRDLHQQADSRGVLRIDERPDLRHPERPKELLTLGRGEPVVLVLDVLGSQSQWASRLLRVSLLRVCAPGTENLCPSDSTCPTNGRSGVALQNQSEMKSTL